MKQSAEPEDAIARGTWLTARQASVAAGVNERTIRRAIARGDLVATRESGQFRIAPEALQAYQQRQPVVKVTPRQPSRGRRLSSLASLPVPPTAMIGREREVRLATELLAGPDGRLLTLTGPGGVGKTRLALAIAIAFAPTLKNGAVFVPLEAVREPEHVITSIAQILGTVPGDGKPPRETLIEAIRHRQQLLILDNFEHLLAAATIVAELLAAGPGLRLLVTSRAALHLRGETELVVPPLALPDLAQAATSEAIGRSPAVELFVRRARAVKQGFALTDDNAVTIGEICQHLDGLPLAIEIAAPRIKHASPATLLSRLEGRLDILADGPRDLPDRLQTMRSAIAWSYDQLNPGEQALFRRLSVFTGGFTIEAADGLSAIGYQLPALDGAEEGRRRRDDDLPSGFVTNHPSRITSDLIASLDDQSLVRRTETGDVVRFVMLETIRAFAGEQLEASGEQGIVRGQQAAYFLSMAESARPDFHHAGEAAALTRLEAELGNFRAALSWASSAPGTIELALRLANGLFWLWYVRGYHLEGWSWFEPLLARPDAEQAPAPLAEALIHAGWLALRMGMSERANQLFADALVRCHDLGLARSTAFARGSCGFASLVGFGDAEQAVSYLEAARTEAQVVGDRWLEAMDEYGLGIAALASGDFATAQALCERSLTLSRHEGDSQGMAASLAILGQLARMRGDVDDAMHIFTEALAHYQLVGDRGNVCTCVESLAGLLVTTGRPEQGALLFGTAAALRRSIGTPVPGHEQARYEADLAAARAALSEDAFLSAWQAGEHATLADAISSLATPALASHVGNEPVMNTSAALTMLTPREREVLKLVGTGHTDRQIGHLLSISPATVTKHVGNALGKLGVHSRTAAAILLLTSTI